MSLAAIFVFNVAVQHGIAIQQGGSAWRFSTAIQHGGSWRKPGLPVSYGNAGMGTQVSHSIHMDLSYRIGITYSLHGGGLVPTARGGAQTDERAEKCWRHPLEFRGSALHLATPA